MRDIKVMGAFMSIRPSDLDSLSLSLALWKNYREIVEALERHFLSTINSPSRPHGRGWVRSKPKARNFIWSPYWCNIPRTSHLSLLPQAISRAPCLDLGAHRVCLHHKLKLHSPCHRTDPMTPSYSWVFLFLLSVRLFIFHLHWLVFDQSLPTPLYVIICYTFSKCLWFLLIGHSLLFNTPCLFSF